MNEKDRHFVYLFGLRRATKDTDRLLEIISSQEDYINELHRTLDEGRIVLKQAIDERDIELDRLLAASGEELCPICKELKNKKTSNPLCSAAHNGPDFEDS